jgi:hypothetical protein
MEKLGQAVLNGEIGDEKIYICPPDWWQEPVSQGHALLLMKSKHGIWQAARQWHQRISGWMELHDYIAVNNEKAMFMKWEATLSCIDCLLMTWRMRQPFRKWSRYS